MRKNTRSSVPAKNDEPIPWAGKRCRFCYEPLEDWNTDMEDESLCCFCSYRFNDIFSDS